MQQPTAFRLPGKNTIRAALLAILAVTLVGAAVTGAATKSPATKRVVGQAPNATLGKSVLTTTKGRTLYSLSVEKHGKFICTGSCLSVWRPLVVPAGIKPTGPVTLGTVTRPEGGTQVTYRGRPLYRFAGDAKAGDANGEGIKDVGTWHAAAAPGPSSSPQTEQPAEPTPVYPPTTPPTTQPPSEPSPPYQPPCQPPYPGY